MPPDNDVERRVEMATKIQSLTDAVGHVTKCVEDTRGLTRKVYSELHDSNGLFVRMKIAEGDIGDNAKTIENHKEAHKWWRQNIARVSLVIAGSGLVTATIYLIKAM